MFPSKALSMKAFALSLLLLAATPLLAQQTASTNWMQPGMVWQGMGTQPGFGDWSIELVFQPDGNARIRYPSLDCAGTLTRLKSGPQSATYTETIQTGIGRCTDQGTVQLAAVKPGYLSYTYRLQDQVYHGHLALE
jgi:hypothetical protein